MTTAMKNDQAMTTDHVGRFVWHDLMTTAPTQSSQFYADLVGWKVKAMSMGPATYHEIKANERDIGGMMPFDPALGFPSHWVPYVCVTNLEERIARAEQAGATCCVPPHPVPGVGRFALLTDPQGALINFFEYSADRAQEPKPAQPEPLTFCWNELLTTDPKAAGHFYSQIFDWTITERDFGPMGSYLLCQHAGRDVAGILGRPMPAQASHRPLWLGHLLVPSSDTAMAKAEQLGAKRLMGPQDVPGMGRFYVIEDPQGAMVALFSGG